jgi:hypothetical protein
MVDSRVALRLPWGAIATWLLAAIVMAWLVGFGAGVIVRLVVPPAIR